jgi:hypothetical protein
LRTVPSSAAAGRTGASSSHGDGRADSRSDVGTDADGHHSAGGRDHDGGHGWPRVDPDHPGWPFWWWWLANGDRSNHGYPGSRPGHGK